ncbi:hypothetical protein LFU01_46440 [Lysinibacillus fusiformis]|nr:hypothetical protein BB14905_13645 [Bacillus sp. B14905]GED66192.1 hypothetical protein LFU01_46440 [Lysinibacillus fusiformis]
MSIKLPRYVFYVNYNIEKAAAFAHATARIGWFMIFEQILKNLALEGVSCTCYYSTTV